MVSARIAGGILTIDLAALVANWQHLADLAAPARAAAVVKADAYGIGARQAIPALAKAGCRTFCVATIGEGIAARALTPDAEILILNGLMADTEREFRDHDLTPVLNDPAEIEAWGRAARERDQRWPAAIHLDTGMTRLGLDERAVERLIEQPDLLAGIDLRYWLSHLVAAEEADDTRCQAQLARFGDWQGRLKPANASLANSSGIFRGGAFHLDLVRPGVALHGANPTPGQPNPMRQVVQLQGRILQVRDVDRPLTVGYGAAHAVPGPGRIATVAVGYADGYFRTLGGRGFGVLAGHRVPVVGRVSMDTLSLDVSDVPPEASRRGALVDLIGGGVDLDELAGLAGTIAYELLTALGRRFHREYLGGAG